MYQVKWGCIKDIAFRSISYVALLSSEVSSLERNREH